MIVNIFKKEEKRPFAYSSIEMRKPRRNYVWWIVIAYLLVGIVVSIGQYFITNPALLQPCPSYVAQFKCTSLTDRIIEIMLRPDFWLTLPIWPFNFIAGVFLAN